MSEKLWKCRIIETEDLGEFQVGGVNKVVKCHKQEFMDQYKAVNIGS